MYVNNWKPWTCPPIDEWINEVKYIGNGLLKKRLKHAIA